ICLYLFGSQFMLINRQPAQIPLPRVVISRGIPNHEIPLAEMQRDREALNRRLSQKNSIQIDGRPTRSRHNRKEYGSSRLKNVGNIYLGTFGLGASAIQAKVVLRLAHG